MLEEFYGSVEMCFAIVETEDGRLKALQKQDASHYLHGPRQVFRYIPHRETLQFVPQQPKRAVDLAQQFLPGYYPATLVRGFIRHVERKREEVGTQTERRLFHCLAIRDEVDDPRPAAI